LLPPVNKSIFLYGNEINRRNTSAERLKKLLKKDFSIKKPSFFTPCGIFLP